jgi:hypothetical protein
MLLPVPVEQLGVIEVADAGALHRFERDGSGAWFYHGIHTKAEGPHGHQVDSAMAQRIDTAFAGFGRTRIERQFPLDKGAQAYGLATPQMVILVYRPSELQPLAQYSVGDIAPDTLSRYILVVGSSTVATIANYQIENLVALVKAAGDASGQSGASAKAP